MSILISHSSALELLRALPPQLDAYTRSPEPLRLADVSSSYSSLKDFDFRRLGLSQQPVHLLISNQRRRGEVRGTKVHRTSLAQIPAGLALELAPGVYCVGPELCFAQIARHTSIIGSVVLGCELCGRYSQFAKRISGFYDRPPLTSIERIDTALDELAGLYGLSDAYAALPWVQNGARSPMETVLLAELSLPTELGGLAFERPRLNYPIELDAASSELLGQRVCVVDGAWPEAKRGYEYNGGPFHQDQSEVRKRIEALGHMGWNVTVIGLEHMANFNELQKTVSLFEGDVPRLTSRHAPIMKTRELHQRLLRSTRFGMGLEAALFGAPVERGQVPVHLEGLANG